PCLAALSAIVLGACGHTTSSGAGAPPSADATPGATAHAATQKLFDARSFSNGTKVDNKYYPLVPGAQLVLEGEATRAAGRQPHRLVLTVTDLTKVIDGVTTRVIWDVDTNDGVLAEAELAFHAQDDHGNVWNLGEYPEEESLVLASARMLTPAELATVRVEALKLDHHGYDVSKDYAQTAPAQAPPGV